jgi:uridylate kinase
VTDPSSIAVFPGRILVASGWKPGFSTDFDAVVLAERFQANTVINLSNIAKVYTADPKKDRNARPIDTLSWAEFRAMVGEGWSPGSNLPFDPVASKRASEIALKVVCAAGRDLTNLDRILRAESFVGTTIGPQ